MVTKKKVTKLPTLVQAGGHLIDPTDVACITRIRSRNLYIVRLKSQPNMDFPIWVKKAEIEGLLTHFNIEANDVPESDDE